jgi:hypothetical protein
VALTPLWQVEQLPGVTLSWLTVAGVQARVVWQSSQLWLVGKWLADFPVEILPLWQLAH